MVSDPEEAGITLPFAAMPVLTSTTYTVSSFPSRQLRGSIPSTLRLTAYLLAVLRWGQISNLSPHIASKNLLPGGWPTFRGGIPTRWITQPCPAAHRFLSLILFFPQPFPDRHDPDICTLEGQLPLFIVGKDETFLDGEGVHGLAKPSKFSRFVLRRQIPANLDGLFGLCSLLDDEIAFPPAFVIEAFRPASEHLDCDGVLQQFPPVFREIR